MAKVIVTGGAGMIGSNLTKRLVLLGHDVIVVDNLWRGKLDYLNGSDYKPVLDLDKSFFNIDLREPKSLDPLMDGVDYVFHLADIVAGIGYVFNHQGSLFRDNFLINTHVVDSVRRSKIKGYIYAGTACSFPAHLQTGVDAPPLKEAHQYPANPESAYGWSKLMGEYEALLMEKETGIPVAIPVFHNVYGAPADFSSETGQVVPSLVRKAIRWPDEEFVVWGSGRQGRAFIHVDDIIEGLILSMGKGFGAGPIQIGPNVCTSIREIAEMIVDISGKPIRIKFDTSKPEGDLGRCADFSKASHVLGWSPKIPIREGLENLYAWIESQIALSRQQ